MYGQGFQQFGFTVTVVEVRALTVELKRNLVISAVLPRSVEQRVLSPDQLPDVHGNVTEFITEQAAETHEGSGIADDLFCVGHHFIPVGRSRAGEETQSPLSSAG